MIVNIIKDKRERINEDLWEGLSMKEIISEVLDKFWKFIWKTTYSFVSWALDDSQVDVPDENIE